MTTVSTKCRYVPKWVKNNARWWAEDMITDREYYDAIEWLIKKGIIKVGK